MNKRLASITLTAGLLSAPQLTNDTDANIFLKESSSPKKEEITKIVNTDILFTIDDGPSTYMLDIAETLDSLHYR